jgi:amyloid beta precursor protein binding protein 1
MRCNELISPAKDAELSDEFALQPSLFPIYLALRATETLARHPSHPGPDDLTASDILREISATVAPGADADERLVAVATEVARARGAELHNISALTGGMVAQEVIKLITRQYVPVDNVCVFDGVRSRTQVFRV